MSVFAPAIDNLFADPNIARDATYIADGGAPQLIRVVIRAMRDVMFEAFQRGRTD